MSILYVNGDSHSAGAEAVNTYCFAEDDSKYRSCGRMPHPDNLSVSYGAVMANEMKFQFECEAESASSNARIIRTTEEYLNDAIALGNKPDLVIIGWSTWEREEWWDDDTKQHWQINAGGMGHDWPKSIQKRYRHWVIDQEDKDPFQLETYCHHQILNLHITLQLLNIPHIFFNTYSCFGHLKNTKYYSETPWNNCYINPYDEDFTFFNWCKNKGFKTVNPNSYHYGADAHEAWAEFLLQNYVFQILTKPS
jgi:hypothetical protein